jgi:hypothetical protein
MAAKCFAIAKAGSRCSRTALPGKQFCLIHDPESADLRREASRKGGHARSNQARAAKQIPEAMAPEELVGWLWLLIRNVISGKIEPKVATAAATIARTILETRDASEKPGLAELEEQSAILRAVIERGDRIA